MNIPRKIDHYQSPRCEIVILLLFIKSGLFKFKRFFKANRLFLIDFILVDQVLVHGEIERKVQRFPTYSLHPHRHRFLKHQHPPPERVRCYTWWTYVNEKLSPMTMVYIRFISGDIHFIDLDKCIHVHYYSIIQSIFTALKILHDPPSQPSPQSLETTDLFTK